MSKRISVTKALVPLKETKSIEFLKVGDPNNVVGTVLAFSNLSNPTSIVIGSNGNNTNVIYRNSKGILITVPVTKDINYLEDGVGIIFFDNEIEIEVIMAYEKTTRVEISSLNGNPLDYLSEAQLDVFSTIIDFDKNSEIPVTKQDKSQIEWFNIQSNYEDLIEELSDIEDLISLHIEYKKARKKENILPLLESVKDDFKNVVLRDGDYLKVKNINKAALISITRKDIKKNSKKLGKLLKTLNKKSKHVNVGITSYVTEEE